MDRFSKLEYKTMITLRLILMLLALIALGLAAIGVPASPRINLGWLGLFFWALAVLVSM